MDDLFVFKLRKDFGFTFSCKETIVTLAYPIILLAASIVSLIIFPIVLCKLLISKYNEVKK